MRERIGTARLNAGGAFLRRWWGASIVLVAFGCLVVTGFIGLDFGHHWDEPDQFGLVNATISSGSFLPSHFYNYPSVTYLLSLLGVLPRVLTGIHSHKVITRDQFFVHARAVFLVTTSLGGIWLYLGLRRRAGELGAAFGAATYLLSFQLAYHARWIAPDAVMAMTAALFLWFLVIAWDSPGSRWRMTLPAVAAGLATATKYQGAVLMLPVVVLFVREWRADPTTLAVQIRGLLRSLAAFLIVFFVITPGAILQRRDFVNDIRTENGHYRTGHEAFKGSFPYDVHGHVTYFGRLARYVVISLPSHWPLISLFVVALAVLGFATLAVREPWLAGAVLLPCVVVPLYFSTLVVFIVRNFLFLLPFIAFLAGVGVGRVAELARFVVSGPLRARFAAANTALPENARTQGPADYVVVLFRQIRAGNVTMHDWTATSRGTYRVVGPQEVDFDFYPTWAGADRVLFFTPHDMKRFGLTRSELAVAT